MSALAVARQEEVMNTSAWSPREALVAAHDMRVVSLMLDALKSVAPRAQLHVTDGTGSLNTKLASVQPALLLVDLNLVDYSVRDLVAQARGLNQGARVIVIAGHGDDDRVLPALRGEAAGFLLKYDSVEQVAAQLGSTFAGMLAMTPSLARQLMRHIEWNGLALEVSGVELELLRWIALGDTPAEVAWRLKLERSVVREHIRHVFEVVQLPGQADV